MGLIRNDIEIISVPGFGEVPFRVQIEESGALCISAAPGRDDPAEAAALDCIVILQDYFERHGIEHRQLPRRDADGNSRTDALMVPNAVDRVTEFIALFQLMVDPVSDGAS